jgi:hypothetical protein
MSWVVVVQMVFFDDHSTTPELAVFVEIAHASPRCYLFLNQRPRQHFCLCEVPIRIQPLNQNLLGMVSSTVAAWNFLHSHPNFWIAGHVDHIAHTSLAVPAQIIVVLGSTFASLLGP